MKADPIVLLAMVAGFAFGWATVLLLIQWYWWSAAAFVAGGFCLWSAHKTVEVWVSYWFAFFSKNKEFLDE